MANIKVECPTCKATCWTRGHVESDTNAVVFDENDPMDDACQHIKDGGEMAAVDFEEEDYDD